MKHKFILPDSRERKWFKGCVTRVVKKMAESPSLQLSMRVRKASECILC